MTRDLWQFTALVILLMTLYLVSILALTYL
jgi:hypothetical protein